MKLYWSNALTAATTLMLLALCGFIGNSVLCRAAVRYWGRRCLLLLVCGLAACCLAAARDGLDQSIQYAIDGSGAPGIFPLLSVPTVIGCIGAALILTAAVASLIARSQHARQLWFYVMSFGVLLKIATVEAARIFMY